MSPKKPIRPPRPGIGHPSTPDVRLPDIIIPVFPTRAPTGSTSVPSHSPRPMPAGSTGSGRPGGPDTTLANPSISVSSVPTNDLDTRPSLSKPLTTYIRPAPKKLPEPNEHGLRSFQGHTFVNIQKGVAMVRYDDLSGAWYATTANESRASGPELYRIDGTTTWAQNQLATTLRAYQLPHEHQALINTLDIPIKPGESVVEQTAYQTFREQRRQLSRAAAGWYLSNHGSLVQAPVPRPSADASPATLITELYQATKGVVVSEATASLGAKQFLIDNIEALAAQGVKTLYLDRFKTDFDQPYLDHFNLDGRLDPTWLAHLEQLEVAPYTSAFPPYSYLSLLEAAYRQGIKVRALDSAASTQWDADDLVNPTTRSMLSSYHAHLVIQADGLNRPNDKWLALINERNATESGDFPELASIQGVIRVHVEDVMQGPALRISTSSESINLAVRRQRPDVYDVPAKYRPYLNEDIRAVTQGDPYAIYSVPPPVRMDYERVSYGLLLRHKSKLRADSRQFFEQSPTLPTKPKLAGLTVEAGAARLIENVYERSSGLVLGAAYDASGARKFLIDNMQRFAHQNVKTLYVENLLTDFDQPFIDRYQSTAQMPDELVSLLQRQDTLQHVGIDAPHSLQSLISVAHQHGVRVQALDSSASYQPELRRYSNDRSEVFKYFADRIIETDQHNEGKHNWVALVESEHVSTVRNQPGLADLQGAVGIQVVDAGGQPPLSILPDPGRVIARELLIEHPAAQRDPIVNSHQFVKSDLRLEVNVRGQRFIRDPLNPRECLRHSHEFLIEEDGANFRFIRRPGGSAPETVVAIALNNERYSMQYPELPQVHDVGFRSIADLIWGIESSGLTEAARISNVPSSLRLDALPHLKRGMFIFDNTENGTILINRSRDRSLTVTPLRYDAEGNIYINHARWGLGSDTVFGNIDGLRNHLISKIGMTAYNAPTPS